jgi:hypothetical protein
MTPGRRVHIRHLHFPTLGGDVYHPPPGAEPIREPATRVQRLRSNLAPIRPQSRPGVVCST